MESVITLRKNNLMQNGICIYEDQFGNSVFMQKEDDKKDGTSSFVAKLRFSDKSIKAEPLKVTIPVKDDEMGTMLHLDFHEGQRTGEDIDSAIDMYTKIVQRWINLLYDIAILKAPLSGESEAKERFDKLSEYDELKEFISLLT